MDIYLLNQSLLVLVPPPPPPLVPPPPPLSRSTSKAFFTLAAASESCFAFVEATITRKKKTTWYTCERTSDPTLHVWLHEEQVQSKTVRKMADRSPTANGRI